MAVVTVLISASGWATMMATYSLVPLVRQLTAQHNGVCPGVPAYFSQTSVVQFLQSLQ